LQQALAFVAVVAPVVVPTFFQAVAPAWLPPKRVQQPDAEVLTPRDRTAPAAAVFAPERLDPPRRAQQPDALVFTPTVVAVTYVTVVAPEVFSSRRPHQPDSAVFTSRDRTAPIVVVLAPEWIDRRRPQQPDSETITSRDRTAPLASVTAPEWIDRRAYPAFEQLAFVYTPPEEKLPEPAEVVAPAWLPPRRVRQPDSYVAPQRADRTAPTAVVVAPEWIDRRRPHQPDSATRTPPDRTAPAAAVFAPEWIARRSYPAFEQLAFIYTPPEEALPEPAEVVAPVWLPPRRVHQPDSFVATLQPPPTILPQAAYFPDAIDRRAYHAAQQLAEVVVVPPLHLRGVTRDAACTPLPFCTVHLFRTVDDVEVAQQVSDAAGNFDFAGWDGVSQFYVVAYLAGAPDVAGTTVNTLVFT
jgi:hypothetical protein